MCREMGSGGGRRLKRFQPPRVIARRPDARDTLAHLAALRGTSMAIENWERIQDLFLAAADLAGDEQARFLDAHCGTDAALRRGGESLLPADHNTASKLVQPVRPEAHPQFRIPTP